MKKNIQDWTIADIESLVKNRVPESVNLEFKSCDALRKTPKKDWRKEFAKDVSAFANSGGAILIYGIIENRETHEAESIDSGFEPQELNVESLEQILESSIHRNIEGITIKPFRLHGSNQGRYIYVLEIPESDQAPHMASDFRFYKRVNFLSTPMQEHEVRARYGREPYPGKDVAEAWRDHAINPMLESLSAEVARLQENTWTWNSRHHVFNGFTRIANASESGNKEDFIDRHPHISELLIEHDELLHKMSKECDVLFQEVSNSSALQNLFNEVTSEASLKALAQANPQLFRGSTREGLFGELFRFDRDLQERLNSLTEWTINGHAIANVETILAFWRTHSERFRQLLANPPFYAYLVKVQERRVALVQFNLSVLGKLKEIRRKLSERHNIRVEAPRSYDYPQPPWGSGII